MLRNLSQGIVMRNTPVNVTFYNSSISRSGLKIKYKILSLPTKNSTVNKRVQKLSIYFKKLLVICHSTESVY